MIVLRVPDLPGQMVSHKGTIIIAPGGCIALYESLESTWLVESRITPHCQYSTLVLRKWSCIATPHLKENATPTQYLLHICIHIKIDSQSSQGVF